MVVANLTRSEVGASAVLEAAFFGILWCAFSKEWLDEAADVAWLFWLRADSEAKLAGRLGGRLLMDPEDTLCEN